MPKNVLYYKYKEERKYSFGEARNPQKLKSKNEANSCELPVPGAEFKSWMNCESRQINISEESE